MIFFIGNIFILFLVQMLLGFLWYSVFFKTLFIRLAQIDVTSIDEQRVKQTFLYQMLISFLRSIIITVVMLILPRETNVLFGFFIFFLVFPLLLLEGNIWLRQKPIQLIFLDSGYVVLNFIVLFSISFWDRVFL